MLILFSKSTCYNGLQYRCSPRCLVRNNGRYYSCGSPMSSVLPGGMSLRKIKDMRGAPYLCVV